jgi:hypothetical protein
MGIFIRGDRTADADFRFLSADDARVMRGLAAEAFARAGMRVKPRGDHLVGPEGQLFGLYTLAAECRGISAEPEAWIPAVEKHVRTLLMSAGMETHSP